MIELNKPTEEELSQTKQLIKDKYDFDISKSDLVKMVGLIKEMDVWLKAYKSKLPKSITEEMAFEFKDLMRDVQNKDISLSEAYDGARSVLTLAPVLETERISKEIRAIVAANRPVPYSVEVQEKTALLFSLHYDVNLTIGQLEQIVPYLTRTLWYEDGLEISLEDCLDDLLEYEDKIKRGKKAKSIGLHDKLRRAFDKVMTDLKSGEKFDPLFKEN